MKLGDNHRLAPTLRWEFGPADPVEDDRVFVCSCGITYSPGCYLSAHEWKPCGR